MPSTQLANRIIFGSVAFAVGLGMGLLIFRHPKMAFLTGVVAIPAGYTATIVRDRRHKHQQKLLSDSLENQVQDLKQQVRDLERHETQLNYSMSVSMSVHQEIEGSLATLQAERNNLLNRISELHQQRGQLHQEFYQQRGKLQQELISLTKKKQQIEDDYNKLNQQLLPLKKHQTELGKLLLEQNHQIQEVKAYLTLLQQEYGKIEIDILEKNRHQQELHSDLEKLEIQKQELITEINYLENKVHHS